MSPADAPSQGLLTLVAEATTASPPLAYLLIAAAMFLENLFPPLPSELIMPLGGFLVHQGQLELLPVFLAGLLGSVSGASFWYGVGRWLDEERLQSWLLVRGRWLGLPANLLPRSRRWFDRHGVQVVFWGRLIPGVRPFVSLPAGFELMPASIFLLWTTAGTGIWVLLLTLAGLMLGSAYGQVSVWLGKFVWALPPLLGIALAAWGVVLFYRRHRRP
jgi:membrane protein DedA with SNARE-associated domain